jgi:hypothetical protein
MGSHDRDRSAIGKSAHQLAIGRIYLQVGIYLQVCHGWLSRMIESNRAISRFNPLCCAVVQIGEVAPSMPGASPVSGGYGAGITAASGGASGGASGTAASASSGTTTSPLPAAPAAGGAVLSGHAGPSGSCARAVTVTLDVPGLVGSEVTTTASTRGPRIWMHARWVAAERGVDEHRRDIGRRHHERVEAGPARVARRRHRDRGDQHLPLRPDARSYDVRMVGVDVVAPGVGPAPALE